MNIYEYLWISSCHWIEHELLPWGMLATGAPALVALGTVQ